MTPSPQKAKPHLTMRKHRGRKMSEGERAEGRERERARSQLRRSERSAEEAQEARERERIRSQQRRSEQSAQTAQETRERERRRSQRRRSEWSAEEAQEHRQDHAEQQRLHRKAPWKALHSAAFSYDAQANYRDLDILRIGQMDETCASCHALKWKGERPGLCCDGGKVHVPLIPSPPEPLHSLIFGRSTESRTFRRNILRYNAAFQMTSFVADKQLCMGNFQPTFKVQGQVYHLIGSILPPLNRDHKFLQIYFINGDECQQTRRHEVIQGLDNEVVGGLQRMLHDHNDLVSQFKSALHHMPDGNEYRIKISGDRVTTPHGAHPRVWNAPATDEVAVIVEGNPVGTRDIILKKHDNSYIRISEENKFYDALQYPLIWWNGQASYSIDIPQVDPVTKTPKSKRVTTTDFYAYHLMIRQDDSNLLLHYQKLLNKFLVDMWVKAETATLRYISTHQTQLRADQYIHLKDAIATDRDVDPNDLGRKVILPSTFVNSPRYLAEYAQDAMTYARVFHRASLFITFTCNPSWPEIKDALLPGQNASHRQDIIARVFRLKVAALVNVLTKGQLFGEASAFVYSIEWQKRGLPHCHLLLWLKDHIRPSQIDNIISAELPDREADPQLFNTIVNNMIHGPCGAVNPKSPCMEAGKCSKKYPRQFIAETRTDENSYPLYRRRNPLQGGFTATIPMKHTDSEGTETIENFLIDNRWVVPYSPILSKIFDAHINVEFCSSVRAIKYICKYMTKGIKGDFASFTLLPTDNPHAYDEPKTFRAGRYIDSNQAVWRIFHFPLHERHPAVIHLAVHLENGERIYFTPSTLHQQVAQPRKTTLTAFFELCTTDDFAKTLLYSEVPQYYTWDTNKRTWQRRKRGESVPDWPDIFKHSTLGRVYTVHVRQFECFCLRLLLLHTRGPTSFQSLRFVNGIEHPSYHQACRALGLLEDDHHWTSTMEEAVLCQAPRHIRHLFSILLSFCGLSDPSNLWNQFKDAMSEDFLHIRRRDNANQGFDEHIYNEALVDIEDRVMGMCGKQVKDFGLNAPHRTTLTNTLLARELAYSRHELDAVVTANTGKLYPEQRRIFDFVTSKVLSKEPAFIFIQAAGGTGKSFLLNLILADVRRQGHVALALASSGIAGTVLQGGRTAHSVLQLPLDLDREDTPICNITKQSARAQLLQKCKLIVWDEATMSHKRAFEAMDRCLRDVRNDDRNMGGLVVVLAGDFRQTLPVIPKGTPADELDACLKSSPLWNSIDKFELTTNIRVRIHNPSAEASTFSGDLLTLGEGRLKPDSKGFVNIAHLARIVDNEKELLNNVFPHIADNFHDIQDEWLKERAILAPTNATVTDINQKILQSLPGTSHTLTSIDTVVHEDDSALYPTELLNSKEPSGVPPHKLTLKTGVPIILMRNLDPPRLCNGTRLRVTAIGKHIITARILTGVNAGDLAFIPRIPIISNSLGFEFKRLQFPLKPAFAMTINKSQGQTLKVAGIHLLDPCFSHGQLYVACSRVSSKENLHVLAPEGKTINVVYQQVIS